MYYVFYHIGFQIVQMIRSSAPWTTCAFGSLSVESTLGFISFRFESDHDSRVVAVEAVLIALVRKYRVCLRMIAF